MEVRQQSRLHNNTVLKYEAQRLGLGTAGHLCLWHFYEQVWTPVVSQLGSTAIGIQTSEGVCLAVEKRITSPLMEPSSIEKIVEIDTHIGKQPEKGLLIRQGQTLSNTQKWTLIGAQVVCITPDRSMEKTSVLNHSGKMKGNWMKQSE